MLRFQHRRFR